MSVGGLHAAGDGCSGEGAGEGGRGPGSAAEALHCSRSPFLSAPSAVDVAMTWGRFRREEEEENRRNPDVEVSSCS